MTLPRLPEALRRRILAPLLLLLLVYSAASTRRDLRGHDDVSAYEARFGALRARLPKQATVSLLSNLPRDPLLESRELFLVQYVLAPTIVVQDRERPYVLVDVYGDLAPLDPGALAGLEPIVRLGDTGVVLFRRPPP